MNISKARFEKEVIRTIIMDINMKDNLLPGLGLTCTNSIEILVSDDNGKALHGVLLVSILLMLC